MVTYSFRSPYRLLMIAVTLFVLASVGDVVYAAGQSGGAVNIEIEVFGNCVDAVANIYGVKLKPVVVVDSSGYRVHIYYLERYWYELNRTVVQHGVAGGTVVRDPLAAPLVLTSVCDNSIYRVEAVLEELAEKLGEENAALSSRVRAFYEELWRLSRHLHYCSRSGVLLVGVPKSDMDRVLSLVEELVNVAVERINSLYPGYLNIKHVVICGLDENPAVGNEAYEQLDRLLRERYSDLGLRLVRVEYPYSSKSVILDLENPLTGRPMIPVASKYYDKIVRGNKTVAEAIGVAIADALREIDYPARTVDVQVWPTARLVFRPDVPAANPPSLSKSGEGEQSSSTIPAGKADANVAGEGKEVVGGLNTSFTTSTVEPDGGSVATPAAAGTGGNTSQSEVRAAATAAPRAVSQPETDNVEEASRSSHVSGGVDITIATVTLLLTAAVIGAIALSRRRTS